MCVFFFLFCFEATTIITFIVGFFCCECSLLLLFYSWKVQFLLLGNFFTILGWLIHQYYWRPSCFGCSHWGHHSGSPSIVCILIRHRFSFLTCLSGLGTDSKGSVRPQCLGLASISLSYNFQKSSRCHFISVNLVNFLACLLHLQTWTPFPRILLYKACHLFLITLS